MIVKDSASSGDLADPDRLIAGSGGCEDNSHQKTLRRKRGQRRNSCANETALTPAGRKARGRKRSFAKRQLLRGGSVIRTRKDGGKREEFERRLVLRQGGGGTRWALERSWKGCPQKVIEPVYCLPSKSYQKMTGGSPSTSLDHCPFQRGRSYGTPPAETVKSTGKPPLLARCVDTLDVIGRGGAVACAIVGDAGVEQGGLRQRPGPKEVWGERAAIWFPLDFIEKGGCQRVSTVRGGHPLPNGKDRG